MISVSWTKTNHWNKLDRLWWKKIPDDISELDKDEPLDGRTAEARDQPIDQGPVEVFAGTLEPDDPDDGRDDGQVPML